MNRRIAIVLALQTMVLLGMIGFKEYTLRTGIPILLSTKPVDPRALFRGDYVTLRYTINTLNVTQLSGDTHYWPGDPIFVGLERTSEGPYWHAVSSHRNRPAARAGRVVIKGQVQGMSKRPVAPRHVPVRYLIEDYFVPEGKGQALESGKVDVQLAVDRYGRAGILSVQVDGQVLFGNRWF